MKLRLRPTPLLNRRGGTYTPPAPAATFSFPLLYMGY